VLFTVGIETQHALSLRVPLSSAVPYELAGYSGTDGAISEAESRVAGFSEALLRTYHHSQDADSLWFSLFIAYYDQQMHGKTIHSPKNCLPGSGWEALASREVTLIMGSDTVPVNRYLLQNGRELALVLYWYQGRGRVRANEYWVKLDLLKDAALNRRSDESLVRIVVPVGSDEESAFTLATEVAGEVVPSLYTALPPTFQRSSTSH
jgi:EpsI family protein